MSPRESCGVAKPQGDDRSPKKEVESVWTLPTAVRLAMKWFVATMSLSLIVLSMSILVGLFANPEAVWALGRIFG